MPIEDTAFGREVDTSDLARLFASAARGAIVRLSRNDLHAGVEHVAGRLAEPSDDGVWIADAQDDGDLATLAAAALASPLRVLCGSAGLARALVRARLLGLGPGGWNPSRGRPQADECRGPVLVVAGSCHAATAAQVDALARERVVAVRPELSLLEHGDESRAPTTVVRAVGVLSTGQSVVLTTTGLPSMPVEGVAIAVRLASLVAAVCAQVQVGGLVLTGGDTAAAVCHALGAHGLWLTGELEPGIATARLIGGKLDGLPVVTKAGGFGDATALCQAASFLVAGNLKFEI